MARQGVYLTQDCLDCPKTDRELQLPGTGGTGGPTVLPGVPSDPESPVGLPITQQPAVVRGTSEIPSGTAAAKITTTAAPAPTEPDHRRWWLLGAAVLALVLLAGD